MPRTPIMAKRKRSLLDGNNILEVPMAKFLVLAVSVLSFLAWTPYPDSSRAATLQSEDEPGSLKAVIHVNFGDTHRQEGGFRNIEAILAEVGEANTTIVVVCHSDGIGLVVDGQSPNAESIRALQARGVGFAACRNTMRRKMIRPEQLLEGVQIVPSGAVEVIRKQQDGYSYFRP